MNKLYAKSLYLLMVMLFTSITFSYSQTLGTPSPTFTAPCASPTFNTYTVDFTWSPPPTFPSDNVFVLELSDRDGGFSNPVELTTIANSNSTTDLEFSFSFPTDTGGENYSVRVRTTNPEMISQPSASFAAYYRSLEENLVINNFEDVALCNGGSYLISIDNFPNEPQYNWYNGLDTDPIPGEKGPSLIVNQPGEYYVEVDYGSCPSSDTASNIVTVYDGGTGTNEDVVISANGTLSCESGGSVTITASLSDSGYEYTWYRNGVEMDGETSFEITISEGGTYFVEVLIGECPIFSNELDFEGAANEIIIDPGESIPLADGESVLVTASGGDSYQWFNSSNELISSSDFVNIDAAGVYRLEALSGGCLVTKTISVGQNGSDIIPNVLTPNGDNINDQWIIPVNYAFNDNVEVIIYGPTGEIIHQVTGYENDWPQAEITHVKNNPIFYYRILEGSKVLEQGSITLIK